jgi:hypothetical protein
MKKLTQSVLAILVVASTITSCKKGEDDPTISLRSRDSRLVGEWTLTSMEKTVSGTSSTNSSDDQGNSSTSNTTVDYSAKVDGSNKTVTMSTSTTSTGFGQSSTSSEKTNYTETYTLDMEITKEGTVKITVDSKPVNVSTTYVPSNTLPTGVSNSAETGFDSDFGLSWSRAEFDGAYTYVGVSNKTTSQGYWSWDDANKNKVIVNIDNLGRFYVRQLKNKEIILEQIFDDTENGTVKNGSSSMTKKTSVTYTFEAK